MQFKCCNVKLDAARLFCMGLIRSPYRFEIDSEMWFGYFASSYIFPDRARRI